MGGIRCNVYPCMVILNETVCVHMLSKNKIFLERMFCGQFQRNILFHANTNESHDIKTNGSYLPSRVHRCPGVWQATVLTIHTITDHWYLFIYLASDNAPINHTGYTPDMEDVDIYITNCLWVSYVYVVMTLLVRGIYRKLYMNEDLPPVSCRLHG